MNKANNKKNLNLGKFIAFAVGGLVILTIIKGAFSSHSPSIKLNNQSQLDNVKDTASSDTANETLRTLSAQIQVVSNQNKDIIEANKQLKSDIQQKVKRMQDTVDGKLQEVDTKMQEVKSTTEKLNSPLNYPIGGNSTQPSLNKPTDLHITWVDDMGSALNPISASAEHTGLSTKNVFTANASAKEQTNFKKEDRPHISDKPVPRYTIPANSVLADTTAMSGLIGRIPINGVVRDPYPFLLIVGKKDLAANNTFMPDVAGIMVSGTATGDLALSCVRGSITSLTFIFDDGSISTTDTSHQSNKDGTIGYLATPHGNPCLPGTLYTNAPLYLGGNIALGAAQGAAGAFAAAQTTSSTNAFGGTNSAVTGSPTNYVLGQAGVNAANQAQQWWAAREQNSFDAIYVEPNSEVALIVNKEVAIDYNPIGRKVAYENTKSTAVSHNLD